MCIRDRYIALVNEKYIGKQTCLFSLIGFMNAFIYEKGSIELIQHVWRKLSSFFVQEGFLLQLESIISTSPTYTNDVIVQYYEAGNEICGLLFTDLLARLQISLVSQLLCTPSQFLNLSSYLLEIQKLSYRIKGDFSSKDSEVEMVDDFYSKIRNYIPILTEICHFSSQYFETSKGIDLSSDSRALFSFDSRALFIEFMCLIPFLENGEADLFHRFTEVIADSMDKYVLSEVITDNLTKAIVTAGSLLNYFTEATSLTLLRMFPLLVASQHISTAVITDISKIFTIGLLPLNEDAIVSTIYSLNNLLTTSDDGSANPILRERKLTITSGANAHLSGFHRSATYDSLQAFRNITNSLNRSAPLSDNISHEFPSSGSTAVSYTHLPTIQLAVQIAL